MESVAGADSRERDRPGRASPGAGDQRWTLAGIFSVTRPGLLFLALVVYALAFQGTRALWEPDEGRYTVVALEMERMGDYVLPHLNHESIHLTKPPLTYWLMTASLQLFGHNEWAARLPNALAFIATVLAVGGLARRLVPGAALPAPLVYAVSLFPAAAANVATADTILTAWETLAVLGFVELVWGPAERAGRSRLLLWLAFGLAFLTKGPPGLLPLIPITVFTVTTAGGRGARRLVSWPALLVFAVVGTSWYLAVVLTTPGALSYLLGREVYDRMFTSALDRNSGWLGPLRAYGPVVLLGGLPWIPELLAGLRGARGWFTRSWWRDRRAHDREGYFLSLWLALPFVVFMLARSRMPLYLLPLAVPASLLLARLGTTAATSRRRALVLGVWILVIVGGRGALALKSSSKDARALARAIAASAPAPGAPAPVEDVLFVETIPRYGVALYLDAEVERISLYPAEQSPPGTPVYESLEHELAENEGESVFVVSTEDVDPFLATMHTLGREVGRRGDWRNLSFYWITR